MNVCPSRMIVIFLTGFLLLGCSVFDDEKKSTDNGTGTKQVATGSKSPDKGLLNTWFGLNEQGGGADRPNGGGISVNGFLWRAALDTISFMPLAQADPFGGIILTEWYRPPETRDERFKVNIYILDSELRADGLRVSVFRQRMNRNGVWLDAAVHKDTGTNMENAILKRARQMRVKLQ